jgi:hypothetical protein
MDPSEVKTVDASGCTGLTELSAPKATTVYARGCTGLTELSAPEAGYVDASGCTGLTELSAPKATTVYASGCTGLTELSAPEAGYVDARGCTGLTELSAPKATTVYASGCTGLTGYDIIDVGKNARGYDMSAISIAGRWRIIAGCRNFTLEEARRHWGDGSGRAHKAILAKVEKIAAEIERRASAKEAA